MNSVQVIKYCCPVCGYGWEEHIKQTITTGTCDCPNCEEPVMGTKD